MGEHACKTCGDTHRMPAPEDVGGEWPCTRCPTPCRSCACNGGRGAYCATTPCGCACHVARGAANLGNQEALLSRLRAAEERVRELEKERDEFAVHIGGVERERLLMQNREALGAVCQAADREFAALRAVAEAARAYRAAEVATMRPPWEPDLSVQEVRVLDETRAALDAALDAAKGER